ncbi:MAG: hypothetical protein ACQEP5_06110 [Actinomycetota bacterium]
MMLKISIGVFFVLHALVYGIMLLPFPELPGKGMGKFYTTFVDAKLLHYLKLPNSWIRLIAIIVSLTAMAGFIIAAAALFGANLSPAFFKGLTMALAAISVIFIILYWHPYLVVGLAINIAILVMVPIFSHRLV